MVIFIGHLFPATIGAKLIDGFHLLAFKHNLIGDTRRRRLMLGVELVNDRKTNESAKDECIRVFETCRELGLLIGKGGLYGDTMRIRPTMLT
jgi:alanine-glyoxylate transaminase/(R)-3-amino-2-methylpropionate-pyruvate transaminase